MNTRPTPETDAFAIKFKTPCGEKYWVPVDIARRLESERDEARFDLDFRRRLGDWQNKAIDNLERERDEARGQRDKLAEALQTVINEDGTPMSIDRADEALQSIITTKPISK